MAVVFKFTHIPEQHDGVDAGHCSMMILVSFVPTKSWGGKITIVVQEPQVFGLVVKLVHTPAQHVGVEPEH